MIIGKLYKAQRDLNEPPEAQVESLYKRRRSIGYICHFNFLVIAHFLFPYDIRVIFHFLLGSFVSSIKI